MSDTPAKLTTEARERDYVIAYLLSVVKCLLLDNDRSAAVEKYRVAEGHFHRLLAAKGGRDVNG